MQLGEVLGREASMTTYEGIVQLLQYRQAEVDSLKIKLAAVDAEIHEHSAAADKQAVDLERAIASKQQELEAHGDATDGAVKRMGDIETQILDAQQRTAKAACQMEADTLALKDLCQRRALASVNFKNEQALRGLATDLNAKLVQAQRTGRFLTVQLQTRLQELRALRDAGNEEATFSLELHEEQLRQQSITQEVQALEAQEQKLIQELREKIKQESKASSRQSSKQSVASNKESLEAQIEAAQQEQAELSRESFRYAQKCLELEAQLGELHQLQSTKRLNTSQLLDQQDWAGGEAWTNTGATRDDPVPAQTAPAAALASTSMVDVLDCGTPESAQIGTVRVSKLSALPTQPVPAEAPTDATAMGQFSTDGRPEGLQPTPSPRMPLFQMVGGQFTTVALTNAVPAAPIKTSSLVSSTATAATPSVAVPASAVTTPSIGTDSVAPATATPCQSAAAPADAAMSGTAPNAAPPVAASRYLTAEELAAMTPDTAMVAAAPVAVSAVNSAEERPMEGAIPLLPPGVMVGNAAIAVPNVVGRQYSTGIAQTGSANLPVVNLPVVRSRSVALDGSDSQQNFQMSTTLVPTVTVSGFTQPATLSGITHPGDSFHPLQAAYFTQPGESAAYFTQPFESPPVVPEEWHFEQSCKMSEKLDPRTLVGKVRMLDGAVVNSVAKAIEGLNDGSLECPEGFCLIWSLSSQCWFLLWRGGQQEAALSAVGLAEVEEPQTPMDSVIECQFQEPPPEHTFVQVVGGFGTAMAPGMNGMSPAGYMSPAGGSAMAPVGGSSVAPAGGSSVAPSGSSSAVPVGAIPPGDGSIRVTVETLPGHDTALAAVPLSPNRGMEPSLKTQQNLNGFDFPPTSSAYAMDGGSTYQGSAISTASGSGTPSTGYVVPSTSSSFSVQQSPYQLRTQYGANPEMLLAAGWGDSGAYPTLSGPPSRSGGLSYSVQRGVMTTQQPTTYSVGVVGDFAGGYGTNMVPNTHSVMRFESAPLSPSQNGAVNYPLSPGPLSSSRVRRSSQYGFAPSVMPGLEAVTEHTTSSFPPDAFRPEVHTTSSFPSDVFRPDMHNTSTFPPETYRSDTMSVAASTVVDSLKKGRTPLASSRITQAANVGDRSAFGSGRFAR